MAKKKASQEEEKAAEFKRLAEVQIKLSRNPARVWVQIATGRRSDGMPYSWRRIKNDAPNTLAGQRAWTIAYGQSRCLLVGPFTSSGYARKVVDDLKKEGARAITFSTDAGQEIERLDLN